MDIYLIITLWTIAGIIGAGLLRLVTGLIDHTCSPIKVSTLILGLFFTIIAPVTWFLIIIGFLVVLCEYISNTNIFNMVIWNPCEWADKRKYKKARKAAIKIFLKKGQLTYVEMHGIHYDTLNNMRIEGILIGTGNRDDPWRLNPTLKYITKYSKTYIFIDNKKYISSRVL